MKEQSESHNNYSQGQHPYPNPNNQAYSISSSNPIMNTNQSMNMMGMGSSINMSQNTSNNWMNPPNEISGNHSDNYQINCAKNGMYSDSSNVNAQFNQHSMANQQVS